MKTKKIFYTVLALLSVCGALFLSRLLRAEVVGYNGGSGDYIYFYWWGILACIFLLLFSFYQLLAMQERVQSVDDRKLAMYDDLVKAFEKTLTIVEGEYPENQLVDPDMYNIQPERDLLKRAKALSFRQTINTIK